MPWVSFDFGGLDFNFSDVVSSPYAVDEASDPFPKVRKTNSYVPMRVSSGAELSSSEEGEGVLALNVVAIGDTQGQADTRLQALYAVIDAAEGGTLKTYSFQKDATQAGAETWRIIGGQVQPVASFGGPQWIGFGGKFCDLAQINLVVSKN